MQRGSHYAGENFGAGCSLLNEIMYGDGYCREGAKGFHKLKKTTKGVTVYVVNFSQPHNSNALKS